MPFYTSEQILNQALDEATGTLKTSGPSGAAAATAANQTPTNDRLGTPGTGEPAHAGGSTGLIGWLRDILASQDTAVYYTDTTTPLAANASFIGSTRAMLAGNNKFNSLAVSDLGSTTNGFFTQGSTDVGTTWVNHKLLTVPASDPTPSEVQRTVNSYRIGFQNGGSAQAFFSLTSSQTPN